MRDSYIIIIMNLHDKVQADVTMLVEQLRFAGVVTNVEHFVQNGGPVIRFRIMAPGETPQERRQWCRKNEPRICSFLGFHAVNILECDDD